MKWSTTIILILLVAGLGAWVYRDLAKPKVPNGVGTLIEGEPKKIERVELVRTSDKGTETLSFERRGEHWWVTSPYKDRANSRLIDEMIVQPTSSFSDKFIEAPGDLAQYGLDKPRIRVRLIYDGGEYAIRIGIDSGFEGAHYVQLEGQPRIGVLEPGFAQPYSQAVELYRLRTLFDVDERTLARFTRKAAPEELKVPALKPYSYFLKDSKTKEWAAEGAAPFEPTRENLKTYVMWAAQVPLEEFASTGTPGTLPPPPGDVLRACTFEVVDAQDVPQIVVLARLKRNGHEEPWAGLADRGMWARIAGEIPHELLEDAPGK